MSDFFVKENLEYSEAEIKNIVSDIKTKGIAEINDFFKPSTIDGGVEYVDSVRKNLKKDAFSFRYYDMDPCVFTELQKSTHLKDFLAKILAVSGVETAKDDVIHHVIRCTHGETNRRDANKYHFDAYDLTLLMPVITPIDPDLDCGDLVVFLSRRQFSKNLPKNLLFKAIFQSKIIRNFATKDWFKKLFKGSMIKVKPGSAYLFYGFRTYHGNVEMDDSFIRATALFHYHDPLAKSKLIKLIEQRRTAPQNK